MRRFRTVIAVSCAAVALAMLGIGTATAIKGIPVLT